LSDSETQHYQGFGWIMADASGSRRDTPHCVDVPIVPRSRSVPQGYVYVPQPNLSNGTELITQCHCKWNEVK